jgi:hypothetical protein
MKSSILSKASSHRWLLALVGAALSANAAFAAEPATDTQELTRQFILGKSVLASPRSTPAPGDVRADALDYVRQFILGTAKIELVAESSDQATGSRSAPESAHVDSQERVRQVILGLARLADPSRGA